MKYTPPFLFNNGHVQTIYPSLFRKIEFLQPTRERIDTVDDDFIDIDWYQKSNRRLAILSHGLEGNSQRSYIRGMAKALVQNQWDVLAWNYRSCSGEPNRLLKSYHNGVTDDLAWIIYHAAKAGYDEISLVGFSLGANLTLLYLGREKVHPLVKKAAVFSVPCDLKASAEYLARSSNRLYMHYFLRSLHKKIKEKIELMPGVISDEDFKTIKDFKTFDDRYTAPIHGFTDADDYWRQCSSKRYIPNIPIPTLIINAANDPFLPEACYPLHEAEQNPLIMLKIPQSGGHTGFMNFNADGLYWSEKQTVTFFNRCSS